jgi:hypothetical protein
MFIAALFTIAKLWKQPRRPTTYKWMGVWGRGRVWEEREWREGRGQK